jgi:tRNA (guanine-N7-)-methyltransferase
VRRAGRTTTGQAKAFELLGPRYVLPYHAAPLDLAQPLAAPAVVLEIGFGMGDATAHIAACAGRQFPVLRGARARCRRPAQAHRRAGLDNIRILQHDAVEVIDHMLPEGVLDGVHIFFPDPWHKKKHNKRRLIQAPLVAKLAARLSAAATCTAPPTGSPMRHRCWTC